MKLWSAIKQAQDLLNNDVLTVEIHRKGPTDTRYQLWAQLLKKAPQKLVMGTDAEEIRIIEVEDFNAQYRLYH